MQAAELLSPSRHGQAAQRQAQISQIREQQKGSVLAWYKGFWVRKSGHAVALVALEKVRCIDMH